MIISGNGQQPENGKLATERSRCLKILKMLECLQHLARRFNSALTDISADRIRFEVFPISIDPLLNVTKT
jgi:hypothetical protein